MAKTSKLIRVDKDALVYSVDGTEAWRIPIGDIRVVGEYTNDHGAFDDDHFFVFVTSDASRWYEASFYAEGRATFLKALGAKLGNALLSILSNPTKFKSHVMWPKRMEGQALFVMISETKTKSGKGKRAEPVVTEVSFELSEPVRKLLAV